LHGTATEVTGRRGRKRQQLLDDQTKTRIWPARACTKSLSPGELALQEARERPVARLHNDETYRGRGGNIHLYSAALSRRGKDSINPQKYVGDYSQGSKRDMSTDRPAARSHQPGILQFVNASAVTQSDGLTNFGMNKRGGGGAREKIKKKRGV